jgi:hypothetical protein
VTTLTVPPAVRARLGDAGSEGLQDMFATYEMLATARLDHKLDQMRLEWRTELAGIRTEMALMRADMFKWMLMFWVGQFAALVGALSLMLPGR